MLGSCYLSYHYPQDYIYVGIYLMIYPHERKGVVYKYYHFLEYNIPADVTEKLEFVPACFYVKRYVRPKYACRQCQGHLLQLRLKKGRFWAEMRDFPGKRLKPSVTIFVLWISFTGNFMLLSYTS